MSSGTLTVDGSTTAESVNSYIWVHADGTFGGGSLALQYLSADGTYRTIGTPLTANGEIIATLPQSASIKLTLTGATLPSIFYEVQSSYK